MAFMQLLVPNLHTFSLKATATGSGFEFGPHIIMYIVQVDRVLQIAICIVYVRGTEFTFGFTCK